MSILPKWRRKGYGKYLMGKVFTSDPELENMRVYTVKRLIQDYTPSDYDEPGSKFTEQKICAQIHQDIRNERRILKDFGAS